MSLTQYPPIESHTWSRSLPDLPGTYWYDNCWGSAKEDRDPMLLEIELHDGGMGLKAEGPQHVIHGYQGCWAPVDWEAYSKPVAETSSPFERV